MIKRILFPALAVLALLALFAACGKQTPAGAGTDDPGTDAPAPSGTEDVLILSGKDYAIVLPRKATSEEDQLLNTITREVGLGVLAMANDRFDVMEKEIVVGDTNRPGTELAKAELEPLAADGAIHYLVMTDGPVVILYADDPVGYQYLADYFIDNYLHDGVLSVPKDCKEIRTVTWDEYHASDYYAALLKREAEASSRAAAKEEEAKRKEEEARMKLIEYRQQIRTELKEFTLAQFGKITPLTSKYAAPAVYPTAKSHPRVLMTQNSIGKVRAGLTAAENANAYAKYIEFSEKQETGKLAAPLTGKHNMDYDKLEVIESKAFRYAVTGEEDYGYEAIYAIKNYILTLSIPDGTLNDDCRAWGYTIYVAGCVYDWCYDLLTAEDKAQIVAGCESRLGPELEVGFPPSKQGGVTGHGTEAQILRDWLTLAVAAYDEYPDIYEFVAGRIMEQYKPASDYYLQSGSHWQGSAYGPYRLFFLLYSQTIFSKMTDGKFRLLSDDLQRASLTFLHYIRPDMQSFRIGDDYNERGTSYNHATYYLDCFLTSSLYGDKMLKGISQTGLGNFNSFPNNNCAMTPVMFLCINDTSLASEGKLDDIGLICYNGSPLGSYIVRDSRSRDAAVVYMKIGESYSANHEHKDAGNFQIYYKGILASESGAYDSYGSPQDAAYNKQTIASNALLIFNPARSGSGSKWVYSGGQRVDYTNENGSLEDWKSKPTIAQAKILGHADALENDRFRFAYLAGDITNAYDPDTVNEVSRYMIAVATGDEKCPMAFFTYDRIFSDSADFKKTFLLHVQQEPTVADGFAVVRNMKSTNHGKLVVQSVGEETEMKIISGPFRVNGNDYRLEKTYSDKSINEFGWGRIEITPKAPALINRMLTAMYVTDAENADANVKAEAIVGTNSDGAVLFGQAVVFPKEQDSFTVGTTFTAPAAASLNYYVCGIPAGRWSVTAGGAPAGTYEVTAENSFLTFTAAGGEIVIAPAR